MAVYGTEPQLHGIQFDKKLEDPIEYFEKREIAIDHDSDEDEDDAVTASKEVVTHNQQMPGGQSAPKPADNMVREVIKKVTKNFKLFYYCAMNYVLILNKSLSQK